MQFHEAASTLFDLRRFPPRPGTDATEELLAHLGDPHEDLTVVQIAGSNGKGSTARMVESTLRESGSCVGLYTSPHLEDIRERVRVDGRKIPKAAVTEFVERIEPYVTDRAVDGDPPTFFETLTALALWQFDRAGVDMAVLEVGIGGKLDATSVVDPVASAVTSVTLEHTDFLGETVEEIATDKAHVAPEDAALVTATTGDALTAVRETAGEVLKVGDDGSDVVVSYEGIERAEGQVRIDGDEWSVEASLPLVGAHQADNAGVAAVLARQVADIDEATIARGLGNAYWPGRFEVVGRSPLVVLDGAHNPGSCRRVAETLSAFDYGDLHVVAGAMVDKDHRGIAAALEAADHVVACRPDIDRAEDETVVAGAFEAETEATVEAEADVSVALSRALAAADDDDAVLVTGSLYAVSEARTRWTRTVTPTRAETVDDAAAVLDGVDVSDAEARATAPDTVHRVVRTRVRPRQARRLRAALLSLGGECTVSGVDAPREEYVDVVLSGTVGQFEALIEDGDLGPVADQLRDRLDLGRDGAGSGYPWEDGTAIMGILNATPDSFHDGGEYNAVEDAVARAEEMVEAGADIVDVGGESTRPGADPVPVDEEIARVRPVIERLDDLPVDVSIDTRKAAVAEAALEAGADILNDVSGLEDPEMRHLAVEYDAPVIVMHSIDAPVDPEADVEYDDVVADVIDQLRERVLLAEKAGLDRSQILVDPGIGFGKTPAEDFELLGRLGEFRALGCPILVGHSHKSLFGHVDRAADDRLAATVAATALATERGADVIRVHDVDENVAARDVVAAAEDPSTFGE